MKSRRAMQPLRDHTATLHCFLEHYVGERRETPFALDMLLIVRLCLVSRALNSQWLDRLRRHVEAPLLSYGANWCECDALVVLHLHDWAQNPPPYVLAALLMVGDRDGVDRSIPRLIVRRTVCRDECESDAVLEFRAAAEHAQTVQVAMLWLLQCGDDDTLLAIWRETGWPVALANLSAAARRVAKQYLARTGNRYTEVSKAALAVFLVDYHCDVTPITDWSLLALRQLATQPLELLLEDTKSTDIPLVLQRRDEARHMLAGRLVEFYEERAYTDSASVCLLLDKLDVWTTASAQSLVLLVTHCLETYDLLPPAYHLGLLSRFDAALCRRLESLSANLYPTERVFRVIGDSLAQYAEALAVESDLYYLMRLAVVSLVRRRSRPVAQRFDRLLDYALLHVDTDADFVRLATCVSLARPRDWSMLLLLPPTRLSAVVSRADRNLQLRQPELERYLQIQLAMEHDQQEALDPVVLLHQMATLARYCPTGPDVVVSQFMRDALDRYVHTYAENGRRRCTHCRRPIVQCLYDVTLLMPGALVHWAHAVSRLIQQASARQEQRRALVAARAAHMEELVTLQESDELQFTDDDDGDYGQFGDFDDFPDEV
jgi:hypothetical protein